MLEKEEMKMKIEILHGQQGDVVVAAGGVDGKERSSSSKLLVLYPSDVDCCAELAEDNVLARLDVETFMALLQ